MATTVSFNGTNYSVPNNRDPKGWGTALTAYLVALGTALAKSGGNFTLTADVNFGANYGLIAVYYKSASANIATVGVFRLANDEGIAWRNAANSANLLLKVDTSNDLVYDGNRILDTTDILDEDNMASDSATAVPSQQSVKAYVDTGLSAKVNTTDPVLNGSVTGTGVLDEDNMASDSATKLATQQSIKAYVDTEIAAATGGGVAYHAQSGSYTVLDGDGYRVIGVTTGASDATITLPTAADNTDRRLTIVKADSDVGEVIIDGEGSETINGSLTQTLTSQYDKISLVCTGTEWLIVGIHTRTGGEGDIGTITNWASPGSKKYRWVRTGNKIDFWWYVTATGGSGSTSTTTFQFDLPSDVPSPANHISNDASGEFPVPCSGAANTNNFVKNYIDNNAGTYRPSSAFSASTSVTYWNGHASWMVDP